MTHRYVIYEAHEDYVESILCCSCKRKYACSANAWNDKGCASIRFCPFCGAPFDEAIDGARKQKYFSHKPATELPYWRVEGRFQTHGGGWTDWGHRGYSSYLFSRKDAVSVLKEVLHESRAGNSWSDVEEYRIVRVYPQQKRGPRWETVEAIREVCVKRA